MITLLPSQAELVAVAAMVRTANGSSTERNCAGMVAAPAYPTTGLTGASRPVADPRAVRAQPLRLGGEPGDLARLAGGSSELRQAESDAHE